MRLASILRVRPANRFVLRRERPCHSIPPTLLALADMNVHADSNSPRCEGWNEVQRAPRRICCSVEQCEDAIAGVFCAAATIFREDRIDELIVCVQLGAPCASPAAVSCSVDPTMSVNTTVVSTRSLGAALPVSHTNSSTRAPTRSKMSSVLWAPGGSI